MAASLLSIATKRNLLLSLAESRIAVSVGVQSLFRRVSPYPGDMETEWLPAVLTFSSLVSVILPLTLNRPTLLSSEMDSTSSAIVTLTLSPLSGREYSSSRFETRELFDTIVSPGLMSRRRSHRSSGVSTTSEHVPCFGMKFDTIKGPAAALFAGL